MGLLLTDTSNYKNEEQGMLATLLSVRLSYMYCGIIVLCGSYNFSILLKVIDIYLIHIHIYVNFATLGYILILSKNKRMSNIGNILTIV